MELHIGGKRKIKKLDHVYRGEIIKTRIYMYIYIYIIQKIHKQKLTSKTIQPNMPAGQMQPS